MNTRESIQYQALASTGVDVIKDTSAHTPPTGVRGWKSIVALQDTVVAAFTDNGDLPSTGIVGATITAGNFVTAHGLFTSVQLTSGTAALIRG